MSGHVHAAAITQSDRLLTTLTEQLKMPWVQVSRMAELGRMMSNEPDAIIRSLQGIELAAQSALQLIEGYVLSVHGRQQQLDIEPVSISSAFYNVAQKLDSYAKVNACDLELRIEGKYGPVMANRRALEAALVNLGYSFIEAANGHEGRNDVQFVIRRTRGGISAGVYSEFDGLSSELLRRARSLYGRARQPLNNFTAANGAGVFVADALITGMDSTLRVSSYEKRSGLAASFSPSAQLSLV